MSRAATNGIAEDFSERVIPLLKEYHEKLAIMRTEAGRIKEDRRRGDVKGIMDSYELRDRFSSLKPAAVSLARHVSQRLEHGDLDEMDKLELTLRLAEFEHALLAAEKAVADAQK
jgi:hypothetical protein